MKEFKIRIKEKEITPDLRKAIIKSEKGWGAGKIAAITCQLVTVHGEPGATIEGFALSHKEALMVQKTYTKIRKKRAKKKAKKERKKAEREMAKKRSLRHWLSELIEYPWKGPFDGLDKTWPNKFDPSESDNRAK